MNAGYMRDLIKKTFNAECRAVRAFRRYAYIYNSISKLIGYILYNRAKIKYGCDIAPTAIVGKNFKIVHLGAIVIGRNAILGDNVTIQSCVTIGMKNPSGGMPNIANNVYIGTGAKLLGDIRIGDGCIIGANSVVLNSFKAGSVVAGIPAKMITCNTSSAEVSAKKSALL